MSKTPNIAFIYLSKCNRKLPVFFWKFQKKVFVNRSTEYGSPRSEQPPNVKFEPITRGLKVIFWTEMKCKVRFIYVRFNNKRKDGVKNGWKKVPLGVSDA